jgi:translation initiation factor IF-3
MPPEQALSIAQEKELDLVEVAPSANPPVCRIMNAGKFFYEQAKRENEARKKQKHIEVREVKFRPKIGDHDVDFKKKNIIRWLSEGNKVKAAVQFRGREIVHVEVGRQILDEVIRDIGRVAVVETPPKLEGNMLSAILGPSKETRKATEASHSGAPVSAPRPARSSTGSTPTNHARSPRPQKTA